MMNPASVLDRSDFFLLFGIIAVFSIGLTAVGITLYHIDGGPKSTRQIIREGVIGYFLPLVLVVRFVGRFFKRK